MLPSKARFTLDDLDWFATASHDRSPLHVDAEHARRSPFGDRVAHGVLAALGTIALLTPRPGRELAQLTLEFPRPVLAGVAYRAALEEAEEEAQFHLSDGPLPALRGAARFVPRRSSLQPAFVAPRREARSWREEELGRPFTFDVNYGPTPELLDGVMDRFGLDARGLPRWQAAILLGASYLVGMELPGASALFSRLKVTFQKAAVATGSLRFRCAVRPVEPRTGLVRLDVTVLADDAPVASANIRAFLRGAPTATTARRAPDTSLEGKVAVVIGGSRGLGAALVAELRQRGAHVVTTQRTAATTGGAEAVEALALDASSAEACDALRAHVLRRFGRVDMLFCNASPALRPLWLHADARARLVEYVAASTSVAAFPLMTLVDLVPPETGWVTLVSSSAVTEPVAEWPHYVAAKRALEGLLETACVQYPRVSFLVARPPRIRTDFSTAFGSTSPALDPATVALAIADRIAAGPRPGVLQLVDAFVPTAP